VHLHPSLGSAAVSAHVLIVAGGRNA